MLCILEAASIPYAEYPMICGVLQETELDLSFRRQS